MMTTVGADLCVRPEPEKRRPKEMGVTGMGGVDSGQGATDPGQGVMKPEKGAHVGAPLHGVLQWFKTMSTNEYIRGVKQRGWMPFPGKLWQRNYYEHIVRNESELNRIRQYIIDNPGN